MLTSNTIFSVFSFVGFLVIIPLPWQLKAWNTGTCLYIIWTALTNLVYCVNSIVWSHDTINRAPVWCDISSRLIFSSPLGISAASLCINLKLYRIISLANITWTKTQKRRMIMFDLAIGVGIPVLSMVLQYFAQGWRFIIIQEIGCYPGLLNTPLTIVLVHGPPVVLALISAFFAVRNVLVWRRAGQDLKRPFSTSGLNPTIWYRLLALAGVEVLIIIPLLIYFIIENAMFLPRTRWTSWERVHSDISRILVVPSPLAEDPAGVIGQEFRRWSNLFYAVYFFALFGLMEEAQRHYKAAWSFLIKYVGRITPGTSSPKLRFETPIETICFRKYSRACDSNVSSSSGWDTDNHTILHSVPGQVTITPEPLPRIPDIAHIC